MEASIETLAYALLENCQEKKKERKKTARVERRAATGNKPWQDFAKETLVMDWNSG